VKKQYNDYFSSDLETTRERLPQRQKRTWSTVNFFLQYLNKPPSSPFVSSTHASSYLETAISMHMHPYNKKKQRATHSFMHFSTVDGSRSRRRRHALASGDDASDGLSAAISTGCTAATGCAACESTAFGTNS
jgi:hypothetical protein